MATMSAGTVAYNAAKIQRLVDEWSATGRDKQGRGRVSVAGCDRLALRLCYIDNGQLAPFWGLSGHSPQASRRRDRAA